MSSSHSTATEARNGANAPSSAKQTGEAELRVSGCPPCGVNTNAILQLYYIWFEMTKDIYRREKSSVSKINLHLVFVVKYRKQLFTKEILDSMKNVMNGVAKKMNFKILEIEGETDHVHLLVEIPPKLAVSQMVNALKGVSSRMLRKNYPQLRKYKSLWSPSYFAISCGGAPQSVRSDRRRSDDWDSFAVRDAIENYIREQSTPEGAGSNPNSER